LTHYFNYPIEVLDIFTFVAEQQALINTLNVFGSKYFSLQACESYRTLIERLKDYKYKSFQQEYQELPPFF
jgi:hypothetical protein